MAGIRIENGKPRLKEQDILQQCVEWLIQSRVPYVHHRNTGAIHTDGRGRNFFMRPKFSQKGASDLIINWRGHAIAVELKSEIGKLSADQIEWLAAWRKEGGYTFICRSLDDLIQSLSGVPF